MKLLFIIEPVFFDTFLNGARIPMFLRMVRAFQDGAEVHVRQGGDLWKLDCAQDAPTMDAAHRLAKLTRVTGPQSYALAVYQKGQSWDGAPGIEIAQRALMLNDARARQAGNQLYELCSGRFGFDLYRLSAPLRYMQGLRRDVAQMDRFDIVYVQTAPEAAFLRRKAPGAKAQIEMFNNALETKQLFPASIQPRGTAPRDRRFLLPVPPGVRREAEYVWFLRRLAGHPDLARQTTVQARAEFAPHVPEDMTHDSDVPDFQAYLAGFDCVLVPTKHYTGLNNRVFQAAAAGCHVIASPDALEGLIPGTSEQAHAPKSFAQFRAAMARYPEHALTPEVILSQ
ncbi:MAG: hypothetical protein N4A61_02005 [Pelagimonas sp.]|jgi:hypothetical protein|nr:hypothetical protein [Pelagimonas sp.]